MPPPTINVPTCSAIHVERYHRNIPRVHAVTGIRLRWMPRVNTLVKISGGGSRMFSFENKKALVTGGGRGIGRAIALALARQGVEMVDAAAKALGGLDILVNNAGGILDLDGSIGPLAETTLEAFDAMYALNVRSPLFAAVAASKHMAKQGKGGAIVNIVSIDAVFPAPTAGIYRRAKAALVNITRVLGYELGKDRIRVNAIAPGVIETRLTEPWLKTEEQRADRASFYPLRPVGGPD